MDVNAFENLVNDKGAFFNRERKKNYLINGIQSTGWPLDQGEDKKVTLELILFLHQNKIKMIKDLKAKNNNDYQR